MEAYGAFGEKQEAAIQHVAGEVERTAEKVDKLGGKIGEIADYITDQEKAALYKLNTPVDIADLEDAEKRILLAVLYQLSADEDEVTEEQQNYIRAVQQYLKIYNPQAEIDLEAVENIEDISAQKAVMQAVLEFFYLGTHPGTYNDDQLDFLDCFQVNRKTRREINGHISAIVDTVGVKGLAEKYGFVVAQPKSGFARYQDNGRIPEKVADMCIAQYISCVPEFPNGQRFLETEKYLVHFASNRLHSFDTDINDNNTVGFFRIDKQTGESVRLDIDYEKIFHIIKGTDGSFVPPQTISCSELSYCIIKDTIYFVNDDIRGSEVQLFALDIDKKTCLKMPFTYKRYPGDYPVFHLSCNNSYIVICVLRNGKDDDYEDCMESCKVYVVDLTQNNRTFLLTPRMDFIYDALLWNDKFLFWGTKGNIESLFQYDIATKKLENIFGKVQKSSDFYNALSIALHNREPVESLTRIEQIYCVDGKYFFLTSRYDIENGGDRYFALSGVNINDPEEWNNENPFLDGRESSYRGTIAMLDDCAVFMEESDEREFGLKRFTFSDAEITHPNGEDEVPDFYILLGDYLYRDYDYIDEGWQKTNITKGWDDLQWEVMQFPD